LDRCDGNRYDDFVDDLGKVNVDADADANA